MHRIRPSMGFYTSYMGWVGPHIWGITDTHIWVLTGPHIWGITDTHIWVLTGPHTWGITDTHIWVLTGPHIWGINTPDKAYVGKTKKAVSK